MTKWQEEQLQLEKKNVQAMHHEDGIVETTTIRQWKNGTRQFKLPTGQLLATYKSGYVRRWDSSDRIWQLNHKYKRKVRWTMLDGSKLITHKSVMIAREKIFSGLARLNYMLEFYK